MHPSEFHAGLKYRLITGKDDANYCERISNLLEEGYQFDGSPLGHLCGKDVIAAQAVILNDETSSV